MPLEDGDVIDFDYELWADGQERLYDTTLRAAAERDGIHQQDAFYTPLTYVMGSGRIIPGLEKALREAAPGTTIEAAIPAAEAYGERDPKQVETIPLQEFKKNDVSPVAGLPITWKNRRGVVSTVGGGRVRADFNHPLAGKALRYRFTVRKVASSEAEKVAGLLRMHMPSPHEWMVETTTSNGGKAVSITVPEEIVTRRDWVVAKLRALMDIRRFTPVEQVRFVETYQLTAPSAETATPPA